MVKSLPRLLYNGARVFAASVRKSIQEEIDLSREMARIRYQEKSGEKERDKSRQTMSLDEAQKILNVGTLEPQEVDERFKYLFSANKGSLYLQSKIVRAKEAIDFELSKVKEKLPEKRKTNKSLESNIKYFLFTYTLMNERQQ